MKRIYTKHLFIISFLLIFSCKSEKSSNSDHEITTNDKIVKEALFQKISKDESGIDFYNMIIENFYINIFTFDYMYNGSGVAIGDVNNDGLQDIYFTGNFADNKLFINEGNFKFRDVTDFAGVSAHASWCNGATMVDINDDGYLDIYVCRSFRPGSVELRRNLLYVNDGNGRFYEQASKFGIDDSSHSVQSTFFDYDNDGDLDLYLANHPANTKSNIRDRYNNWSNPTVSESNKMYRNDGNGSFTDVTESTGLLDYSFSLGIIAQDFNHDGNVDLFVSNDFEEPDRYYLNNGDGTFTEKLKQNLKHISFFGMGVDAGDINNDGFIDLVTVDMLAEDNYREKTQMSSMNPDDFWEAVKVGFHYQYMRNSLHLNNGDGSFIEIGQFAGIHRTDWSWAPLLADFDNDGFKDLYITNGYRRDSRDKDIRKKTDKILTDRDTLITPEEIDELLRMIPSNKINNYFYRNNGDYTFSNTSEEAGIAIPSFSNGAAYADLDNDGDLDLVVNNLLDTAFVFKNKTVENKYGNFLRVNLNGNKKNPHGIGAEVSLYDKGHQQIIQQTNTRGYLSSVEFLIHFGCGKTEEIDSLVVQWPDKTSQTIQNVKTNQVITVNQSNSKNRITDFAIQNKMFKELNSNVIDDLFHHKEMIFDDYKRQVLLPHKLSQIGPCIAVADIDGDSLDDFFIGGSRGQIGALYLQHKNGFIKLSTPAFKDCVDNEDVGAHFFDSDNDGDFDLYVVSGGNEFEFNHEAYQDRLYLNDGYGNFTLSSNLKNKITTSGSIAISSDFDNDGDKDLFIGGRHKPGHYPTSPQSFLLENINGIFVDITDNVEGLSHAGMVTSAIWVDFFGDNYPELIIAGEWMPIRVFDNQVGEFKEVTEKFGLVNSHGWWNSLESGDFDEDGDIDIIAGNLGRNYKYQASIEKPFHLYSNDFDKNGTTDIVLAFENQNGQFPVRGKQCSSQQLPEISEKFSTYKQFGSSNLQDIYGNALDVSDHFIVNTFSSSVLINNDNSDFSLMPLPQEAQFAPINTIIVSDFNNNNHLDLLLAGNLYVSEVETGRADAGTGLLLLGNGDGTFNVSSSIHSGFWANKDVKTIRMIKHKKFSDLILVGNNNDRMQIFGIR